MLLFQVKHSFQMNYFIKIINITQNFTQMIPSDPQDPRNFY